jgi:hypothetical protein
VWFLSCTQLWIAFISGLTIASTVLGAIALSKERSLHLRVQRLENFGFAEAKKEAEQETAYQEWSNELDSSKYLIGGCTGCCCVDGCNPGHSCSQPEGPIVTDPNAQRVTCQQVTSPDQPRPLGSKRVFFIRHGNGYHNEFETSRWTGQSTKLALDPNFVLLDADLATKGIGEALANVPKMVPYFERTFRQKLNGTTLAVTSPLRRATRTMLLIRNGLLTDGMQMVNRTPVLGYFQQLTATGGIPAIAHEALHETTGLHTCDSRLPKSKLQSLFGFTKDSANAATFSSDVAQGIPSPFGSTSLGWATGVDYSLIQFEEDPLGGNMATEQGRAMLETPSERTDFWSGSGRERKATLLSSHMEDFSVTCLGTSFNFLQERQTQEKGAKQRGSFKQEG